MSSITSTKIPKIKFKDLGNPAFGIETPSEHIKLNCLMLLVAKKGSGKTFFATNLLNMLPFDRIIVVSSTFDSNKKMLESLNIQPEDVLDPDDPEVIQKIYNVINSERDDLIEYQEKIKQYREFEKLLHSDRMISDDLLEQFYNGNSFEPPTHRWNGKKPTIGVFIDDAQNSKIMGSKLSNLCIKHRHLGAFKDGSRPIGCSLFICVQNYTSQGNGLPKAIRGNASHLAIWKTGNRKELELLAREQSGEVDEDTFFKVYNYVFDNPTASRHDFMFVDLAPKEGHTQFRRNYMEFINL